MNISNFEIPIIEYRHCVYTKLDGYDKYLTLDVVRTIYSSISEYINKMVREYYTQK